MNSKILWCGALAAALAALPLPALASEEDGDAVEKAKAIEKEMVALVAEVSKAYVMIGGGSGVVITPDGWMLTNEHVVDQFPKRKKWDVMMPIRKRFIADLTGKDATGDIALLKIRDAKDLPFVPLGDSDALVPGQMVVALGNPFSHAFRTAEPTVTIGIVSAIHDNQYTYPDAIVTDAPLNPGNSGGPMISLRKEMVGINGRVRVRFWKKFNTGVGLAIPSNQIRRFLPLLEKGDAGHGHLTGIAITPGRPGEEGLLAGEVRPGSAAERMGLKTGDRVLSVGGYPVWNLNRFWGVVHSFPEGAKVPFEVARGETRATLEATLVRWYPGGGPSLRTDDLKPGLGAVLFPETPGIGGAEIQSILPNSAASKAGLKPGDIILGLDRKQVMSPKDFEGLLKEFYRELEQKRESNRRLEARTVLRVFRGSEELDVPVVLGPDPDKSEE